MKRIIIIITMVLVITLAAGCTKNHPKAPADDSKASETITTAATDPETSSPVITDEKSNFIIEDSNEPKKPFADLTTSEVDHITVEHGIHTYQMSDEEQTAFIDLLNELIIYGKYDSSKNYVGGSIDFEIVYNDDRAPVNVSLSNPLVFINGEGYNCEYKPCDDAGNYIHDIYLYQFYGPRE